MIIYKVIVYLFLSHIEKALQDLAEALNSNDTVSRVKVTITLVKPKASKANHKSE